MGEYVFQFAPELRHELVGQIPGAAISIVQGFLQVGIALQDLGRVAPRSRCALGGFQAVCDPSIHGEHVGGVVSQIGGIEDLRACHQGGASRSSPGPSGCGPGIHGKQQQAAVLRDLLCVLMGILRLLHILYDSLHLCFCHGV